MLGRISFNLKLQFYIDFKLRCMLKNKLIKLWDEIILYLNLFKVKQMVTKSIIKKEIDKLPNELLETFINTLLK